jgi:c-di-GMP-binding flagellar brake protein YcgR
VKAWKEEFGFKLLRVCADDEIGGCRCEVIGMAERELNEEEYSRPERRRQVAVEGMVERRQHTRYAVDAWAEVMVKDGTMLFRGRVLDVSAGGCYIETEAKLKLAPGTRVEMLFRLNDGVFRCEATSRMVRTKGAGFLFSSLDARMQRELERLIQELDGAAE